MLSQLLCVCDISNSMLAMEINCKPFFLTMKCHVGNTDGVEFIENKYFKIESNYITRKNNQMEFYLIVKSPIQMETYKFHNIFSVYFKQYKNITISADAHKNQFLNFNTNNILQNRM